MKEYKGIKVGDRVVFNSMGMELDGIVESISGEDFKIKTKNSSSLASYYSIVEHYPRNNGFKRNMEDIDINSRTKLSDFGIREEYSESDMLPKKEIKLENNVVVFPPNTKQVKIDSELKNYKDAKYFIVEKNEELHIVKIKDGFQIKPFFDSMMKLLSKRNLIKENTSKMKVVGNDNFVIVKNSPPKLKRILIESLKKTLK